MSRLILLGIRYVCVSVFEAQSLGGAQVGCKLTL